MEFTRRRFVLASLAAAGLPAWRSVQATADVVIVEFSDAGVRLRTVTVPKVVKSDAEWRRQLSPLAFQVARQGGTERAFTGAYWDLHDKGLFRCACCANALFSSAAKFDSGTGWPSFWQPVARENVEVPGERGSRDPEGEVKCRRCDAHLGDVFADGPRPTGLRYCIDSVSLVFVHATLGGTAVVCASNQGAMTSMR